MKRPLSDYNGYSIGDLVSSVELHNTKGPQSYKRCRELAEGLLYSRHQTDKMLLNGVLEMIKKDCKSDKAYCHWLAKLDVYIKSRRGLM